MILTGLARLGRDASVRQTSAGPVCDMALAFNYGKKDADGKLPTQWVDASLWGERGEKLAPFLLKGQQISVVLESPHVETYDSGGTTRAKLVARVLQIAFAGARPKPEDAPVRKGIGPAAEKPGTIYDMDSDLPF